MSKKILIVDDDIDDRELFMEALAEVDATIRCTTATNGEEALEKLKADEQLPDYVFLDLNLPRLNGKQCLEELKKTPRLSVIPVIIYSTSSQESDHKESLQLGAARFLTKPCSFRELCDQLADIVGVRINSGLIT